MIPEQAADVTGTTKEKSEALERKTPLSSAWKESQNPGWLCFREKRQERLLERGRVFLEGSSMACKSPKLREVPREIGLVKNTDKG